MQPLFIAAHSHELDTEVTIPPHILVITLVSSGCKCESTVIKTLVNLDTDDLSKIVTERGRQELSDRIAVELDAMGARRGQPQHGETVNIIAHKAGTVMQDLRLDFLGLAERTSRRGAKMATLFSTGVIPLSVYKEVFSSHPSLGDIVWYQKGVSKDRLLQDFSKDMIEENDSVGDIQVIPKKKYADVIKAGLITSDNSLGEILYSELTNWTPKDNEWTRRIDNLTVKVPNLRQSMRTTLSALLNDEEIFPSSKQHIVIMTGCRHHIECALPETQRRVSIDLAKKQLHHRRRSDQGTIPPVIDGQYCASEKCNTDRIEVQYLGNQNLFCKMSGCSRCIDDSCVSCGKDHAFIEYRGDVYTCYTGDEIRAGLTKNPALQELAQIDVEQGIEGIKGSGIKELIDEIHRSREHTQDLISRFTSVYVEPTLYVPELHQLLNDSIKSE